MRALSKERGDIGSILVREKRWGIVVILIREALRGSAVRALSKDRWNTGIILSREGRWGIVAILIREALRGSAVRARSKDRWNIVIILDGGAVRRRRRSAVLRCAVQCVRPTGQQRGAIAIVGVGGGVEVEAGGRAVVVVARSPDRRWCIIRNIVIIVIREALRCSAVRALSKEKGDIVLTLLREAL